MHGICLLFFRLDSETENQFFKGFTSLATGQMLSSKNDGRTFIRCVCGTWRGRI